MDIVFKTIIILLGILVITFGIAYVKVYLIDELIKDIRNRKSK